MDPTQLVCSVQGGEENFYLFSRCSVFNSSYLTLAQLDLLGSSRTGASSLDRLVTIPRIMFSMRVKMSMLEMKRERKDVSRNHGLYSSQPSYQQATDSSYCSEC